MRLSLPRATYWHRRVPDPNPNITDPAWPGDPFWRSKKYPRELRAKIAHEWHHSPERPTLNQLAVKYGVPNSSLTLWCHAYPFGSREMVRRSYTRHVQANYYECREEIDAALNEYVKELQAVSANADLTWRLMGDPLPSRSAKNISKNTPKTSNVTLPWVPVR